MTDTDIVTVRSLVVTGKRFRSVIEFKFKDSTSAAPHQTTEHDEVHGYRELTWVVEQYAPRPTWALDGWNRPSNLSELLEWPPNAKLTNGWTAKEVNRLMGLGNRWHLNGLKPGCAHMTPAPQGTQGFGFEIGALDNPTPRPVAVRMDGGVGLVEGGPTVTLSHYTVNKNLECPITGYQYGRAWLVEPLADGIEDEILAVMSRHPDSEWRPQ